MVESRDGEVKGMVGVKGGGVMGDGRGQGSKVVGSKGGKGLGWW